MMGKLSTAQERGLILLIGVALLACGIVWTMTLDSPAESHPAQPVLLAHVAILTPTFVHAEPVDVNTAGLEALDSLPGIGPALAARIIQYRNVHGPFPTIESLANVSGIGEQTVAALVGLAVAKAPTGSDQ